MVLAKNVTDLSKKGHIWLQNRSEISAIVRESYSRFGSLRRRNGFHLCFKLFWMSEHNRKVLSDIAVKLPNDLYVDSLKASDADFVDEIWELRFPGSREIFLEKILHFPSIALRQIPDDRLVGFMLTDHLGYGNHGYVLKERRGEGLIGKIATLLWQEHLKKKIIPYGFVFPTNTSSIWALKKSGFFDILDDADIKVLEFTPFSQVPSKF